MEKRYLFFDGEVSTLKEKTLDAKMVDIEFADELFNGVGAVQIGEGDIVMLDKVDERRRCSGFKPVVSVLLAV